MNRLTAFLLMIAAAAWNSTYGQQYYFKRYQVDNGLSHNTVFCTIQDKMGFIWAGTKDGLNRFDGTHFKIFRNTAFDSVDFAPNFILSLFNDNKGILWVGTQHGLYRYDPAAERFHLMKGSRHGDISDIQIDDQGNLWFISGVQLFQYPAQTLNKSVDPVLYFAGSSVCKTADGTIWVATDQGLLKKYDAGSHSFTVYDVFAHSPATTSKWIDDIFDTGKGFLLIGTSSHGIKKFDISNGTYSDLPLYNADKTEIYARDFIQFSENEYWIATESGIFIYDWTNNSFQNITKQYNNPYSLSDNAVYSLCKDIEGGIWAGTYFGGINHYTKAFNRFAKYYPANTRNSISGNAVREICADNYNHIWIGTEDGGLNRLDKNTGEITHYNPTGMQGSIAYFNIHGLLPAGNRLWIGTFEHGLDLMDIASGKVIRHYDVGNHTIGDNFIITLFQTKNGEILAGTSRGIYRYDRLQDKFQIVPDIPSENFIYSIVEESDGTIWASTIGNGVFYFNSKTGEKGNFRFQKNGSSISCNLVNNIFLDSRNRLWFSTEGGGLDLYDKKSKSFRHFNTGNGLPSDFVMKTLEDDEKKLWITTTKGLVCMDPETFGLKIYTKANGLLTDQFNYNSGLKDVSGRLYLGSVRGMISFDPNEKTNNPYRPPLYITGLQINNEEVDQYSKGSPLHTSISDTKKVRLHYDESSFSIDFASLSFISPETIEYAYKLDGLDKEWTFLKKNRKVYYTNLAPGHYIFKVKSTDSNGRWQDAETALRITIDPPFWLSTWAYVFYTLMVVFLIYLIVRNYHQRTEEKNRRKLEILHYEKEKEVYQAKIDFFTNVAHEIRTPLTLIQGPLENIMDRSEGNPDIQENLEIMEQNTNRLVELTDQLLDFREIETDGFRLHFSKVNVSEVLYHTFSNFRVMAQQKGIEISLKMPEADLITMADEDALSKILNNLFSNAIKYAKTRASIKLEAGNEHEKNFTVTCINDGFVVPSHLRDKIFEPFFRIKETQKQKGTGLGLSLSRSLAELHNGSLSMKETNEDLNIFILRLPMTEQKEYVFQ